MVDVLEKIRWSKPPRSARFAFRFELHVLPAHVVSFGHWTVFPGTAAAIDAWSGAAYGPGGHRRLRLVRPHRSPSWGRPPREDAEQMPNDADRAGTPAGVFGAELRFYRTRAGLSQKDLAAQATVSHDVISQIETGERPPAEDVPASPGRQVPRGGYPRRADPPVGSPEEGRQAAPVQLVPGMGRHRSPGHGPALVRAARGPPGLLQTEEYARAILSARPTGTSTT